MIVVLKPNTPPAEIEAVEAEVMRLGYKPHTIRGDVQTVVAAIGDETVKNSLEMLESLATVERVIPVQKKYKLVSREAGRPTGALQIGKLQIGRGHFHVVAGPCSVESLDQVMDTARAVASSGATMIRGGAFKPRTSPYDFQGLGAEALTMLKAVRTALGLPVISEIIREGDIGIMSDAVDVFQVGARNAQNYALLEALAKTGKPILLKRGMSSTIEEWLLAAEYIAKNGNPNVILCERGIRTFGNETRNTLDVAAVAIAKQECNLPVFVDPSHAAGRRDLIPALSKAAIAAGADGLLVEVHPNPKRALSDANQQLTPEDFGKLMKEIEPYLQAAGLKLGA